MGTSIRGRQSLDAPRPHPPPPELQTCAFAQVAMRNADPACGATRAVHTAAASRAKHAFGRARCPQGCSQQVSRHREVKGGTNNSSPQCHTPWCATSVDNCEVMVETFVEGSLFSLVARVSLASSSFPQTRTSLWITCCGRVFHSCGKDCGTRGETPRRAVATCECAGNTSA